MAQWDLTGQHVKLEAAGGSTSQFSASWLNAGDHHVSNPSALDWLLQVDSDMKIALNDFVRYDPADPSQNIYSSSIKLPPGELRAERFGYSDAAQISKYRMGNSGSFRPLAERLVWQRNGLDSLSLTFTDHNGRKQKYKFDAEMRTVHGEGATVSLVFSCSPKTGTIGRYLTPTHTGQFSRIGEGLPRIPELHREGDPNPVTSHGACPPSVIVVQ